MHSRVTGRFWRLFRDLPAGVQRDAQLAYKRFQSNPNHPSLQFKRLEGTANVYSARIGLGYRALAVRNGDRVIWYWIGSHADYDHLA